MFGCSAVLSLYPYKYLHVGFTYAVIDLACLLVKGCLSSFKGVPFVQLSIMSPTCAWDDSDSVLHVPYQIMLRHIANKA